MKRKTRIVVMFLILFFPSKALLSQNSTKFFIGHDLFKGLINEQSFTFGFNLTRHHLIMISLGYTHDNKFLREECRGLSPSQDKYPFLVYKGPTVRSAYEYRFAPFFYVGADIFYKYLYYSNHTFVDSEGDPGDVTFTRDEKSNVFGFHVNSGFIISIPKAHLLINPSIGIGETFKFRNYTTTDSETRGDVSFDIPVGSFSKEQHYLSIMMNLNIAVTF